MKKILTSVHGIIDFCAVWIVLSIVLSVSLHDWTWFGRSGSILTLGGAILAVRPLLRLGIKDYHVAQNSISGGSFGPATDEEIEADTQSWMDTKASSIGFGFILCGTIIWGYGDLVQRIADRI